MKTYKEQFDKLCVAYISGKVDPFDCCACFCGNLLSGKGDWIECTDRLAVRSGGALYDKSYYKYMSDMKVEAMEDNYNLAIDCIMHESENTYTPLQIAQLEALFLNTFQNHGGLGNMNRDALIRTGYWTLEMEQTSEDALFEAFQLTLEYLKQIHIANGETIDETPVFVKRQHELVL